VLGGHHCSNSVKEGKRKREKAQTAQYCTRHFAKERQPKREQKCKQNDREGEQGSARA